MVIILKHLKIIIEMVYLV